MVSLALSEVSKEAGSVTSLKQSPLIMATSGGSGAFLRRTSGKLVVDGLCVAKSALPTSPCPGLA